jgi:hypothetical protein
MIEAVIKHPAGRFTRCRTCGTEPRHIRAAGRTSAEPVQFIASGHRHSLHCTCGARTTRHASLAAAEAQWGTDYAQLALPLPTRRVHRRKVAA